MKSLKYLLLLGVVLSLLMTGTAYGADGTPGFEKGVMFGAQGKFSEARTAFIQASRGPASIPAGNCLGVLDDIQTGRIKEQTGIHLFRGFAYFNAYRPDAAIQELNQAAESNPDYPLIYVHRGDAWADKKEITKAMADYARALEIDPRYYRAYLNRGVTHARQRQFAKAVDDFSQALELNPQYAQAFYSRGNAYAEMGKYDQALADYDRLLALDPRYGHAYVRKAMACEKAGRKAEALAVYKAYLQNAASPDPLQVKFVKDQIQALEKNP